MENFDNVDLEITNPVINKKSIVEVRNGKIVSKHNANVIRLISDFLVHKWINIGHGAGFMYTETYVSNVYEMNCFGSFK